jgi:hypothetical protein
MFISIVSFRHVNCGSPSTQQIFLQDGLVGGGVPGGFFPGGGSHSTHSILLSIQQGISQPVPCFMQSPHHPSLKHFAGTIREGSTYRAKVAASP